MNRMAAIALVAALFAGCTVQRTAEVQTAAAISVHLNEAGLRPSRSLRISRQELAAVQGTGQGLPWLQVFDHAGKMIYEEDGYTLGLAGRLERALKRQEPLSPPRVLADETRKYETFDGEAVSLKPGDADFVFVDHWAMWCTPCKPQSRALQRFIAAHPEWKIQLVLVDWDELAESSG